MVNEWERGYFKDIINLSLSGRCSSVEVVWPRPQFIVSSGGVCNQKCDCTVEPSTGMGGTRFDCTVQLSVGGAAWKWHPSVLFWEVTDLIGVSRTKASLKWGKKV